MRFRTKTILGIGLLQIALLVVLLFSSMEAMRSSGQDEMARRSDAVARLIAATAKDALISQDYATLYALIAEVRADSGIAYLRFVDDDGRMVAESASAPWAGLAERRYPIVVAGHEMGAVFIGLDTRALSKAVAVSAWRLVAIGATGIALTALFAWFLGTYLTVKLDRLRHAGTRLAAGNLDTRVMVEGNDEVADTARAFNAMADRLQQLISEFSESEATSRAFSEASSDWTWETDREHRVTFLSPGFFQATRFDPAILIGRRGWDVASAEQPTEEAAWIAHRQDLNAHRKFRDFRFWIGVGKLAQWISISGAPRYDAAGNFVGYRGSATNITGQAQAATQLRLFSRIVEQSPVSVVVTDPEGSIQYVNSRFTTVTGYAAAEVIGQNPRVIASGDTPQEVYASLWGTISGRRVWHGEMRNKKKSGELYWEDATIFPILDDRGNVAHFVGIKEDITGRKAGEAMLEERTQLVQRHYESLRALSDIAALPHLAADDLLRAALDLGARHLGLPFGIISRVDGDTYTVLHHVAPPDSSLADGQVYPLGDTYCSITLSSNDVVAIPHMADSVHAGHPCYSAFRLESYVGIPVSVRGQRLGTLNFSSPAPLGRRFDDGDVEFIRLLARWVGAMMERELSSREVIAAKDAAEQAQVGIARQARKLKEINAELEQFAYVASHDLRQPLRMVASYLALIQRGLGQNITDEMTEYFGFAIGGAKRMDSLITGLLEYSRTGRGEKPFEPVPLDQVVAECRMNLEVATSEAAATLTVQDGLPTIAGDWNELVRLFQNLMGNALKYRLPDRPAVVSVGWQDEGSEWQVWVRDNGIGIAPEHHDRIFAIFQRLVTQEEYEGSGIGLSVCRKIVSHHGGRIWVDSTPGEGSVFTVAFPKPE
ncbi:hypothetical protein CU669_15330 [Paramagnetospirillum kuznetsovii]|uniref:histidine kinase n=1 Tax=Paramagnetospirillum kuznetsovii TaxID=2053833 RepID=A0A364NV81_9PROT|nr:PAS domain S-box protein [Paramagnetospirillum kuznetsovii]RAU20963.1 hypothetical protein CU669_15330 [Paramagnetospirillum kuznetsovii]